MKTNREVYRAARSILEHFDRSEMFRFPDPDPEIAGNVTLNPGFEAALKVFRFILAEGEIEDAPVGGAISCRARFELQHGAALEFSGRSMEEVVDAIRDNARRFFPFRGLVQPPGAEDER